MATTHTTDVFTSLQLARFMETGTFTSSCADLSHLLAAATVYNKIDLCRLRPNVFTKRLQAAAEFTSSSVVYSGLQAMSTSNRVSLKTARGLYKRPSEFTSNRVGLRAAK